MRPHILKDKFLRSCAQYAIEVGSNCNFHVSQGSVETYLRWWRIFGRIVLIFVYSFLRNLTLKEFCKSVCICRSYDQKSKFIVFLRHTVYTIYLSIYLY